MDDLAVPFFKFRIEAESGIFSGRMRTTLGHMAVGLRINPSEGVGRGEKRKAGVLLNKGGFLEVLIRRSLQIEFAILRG